MPAKLYGQLAGGPVQALRSGLIGIVPPFCKDSHDEVLGRDYVSFQGNVVGDTVSLGPLKSTAFLCPIWSYVFFDALGAGVTVSIGDAAHPTALANAVSAAAAGSSRIVVSFLAAQLMWPLWQRLGWAADPGGQVELLATIGGAAPANAAALGWELMGRNQ